VGGSFALLVSFALSNVRLPPMNTSPRNLCERDHKNQKPLNNVFETQCLKLASPDGEGVRGNQRPMPSCQHAEKPGTSHLVAVRLKFGRPGSPRKAAVIEPFSRALLGPLDEMTRRREIVGRHFERTKRRHDEHIDFVREPLEIVNEPPRDQQGDCVQGPCDRPFRRLVQVASISGWKHDDP
jgi:hypothetical protein